VKESAVPKCLMCQGDVKQGQLSCPNCEHDLTEQWQRPAPSPPAADNFDPFATPAAAPAASGPEEAVAVVDLGLATPPAAPPEARPAAAPSTPCPKCGVPVAGGSRFCDACGAAVGAALCPSCRQDNRPGARFCQHCGHPLTAAAAPAPEAVAPSPVSGSKLLPPFWEGERPRHYRLVVLGKDGSEARRYELKEGENRVGALSVGEKIEPDVDLGPLDARKVVSRRHAVLRVEAGRVTLEDCGSTNGTTVNGRRVTKAPESVDEGAEIVFADIHCRLQRH
jgi:hypothetical protein